MDEHKKGVKVYSRAAMVFSSLWIAILTVCKGMGAINLSIDEIIFSGIAIVGIWCPTFVSIYLDKIKEIKEVSRR